MLASAAPILKLERYSSEGQNASNNSHQTEIQALVDYIVFWSSMGEPTSYLFRLLVKFCFLGLKDQRPCSFAGCKLRATPSC